jgi:hypothetical protein
VIELRPEAALRAAGEALLAASPDCPDCGWKLRLVAPLDDRIHPATRDARPLLLVCELRERVLHPRVDPGEGDGASAWWPRCDRTRVIGWYARTFDTARPIG